MKLSHNDLMAAIKGRKDEKLIKLIIKHEFDSPGATHSIGWQTEQNRIVCVYSKLELHDDMEELIQSDDWIVSIEDIG